MFDTFVFFIFFFAFEVNEDMLGTEWDRSVMDGPTWLFLFWFCHIDGSINDVTALSFSLTTVKVKEIVTKTVDLRQMTIVVI